MGGLARMMFGQTGSWRLCFLSAAVSNAIGLTEIIVNEFKRATSRPSGRDRQARQRAQVVTASWALMGAGV